MLVIVKKPMLAFIGVSLIALAGRVACAIDATWEYAVQVTATVETSPPKITLVWPQDTQTIPTVKALIAADYNADPANVRALFLFGHVPVPYSGNIIPDGHYPDHQGAWPADAYYGDIDGHWTDLKVSSVIASDARNRNVPGDGKFDQSEIPSPVELEVGRVDLAKLPGRTSLAGPATFPSELELLRQYLNKD